jgi:hypothetical protein
LQLIRGVLRDEKEGRGAQRPHETVVEIRYEMTPREIEMWWDSHSRVTPLGRVSRWLMLLSMSALGFWLGAHAAPHRPVGWLVIAGGTLLGWGTGHVLLRALFRAASIMQAAGIVAGTQFGAHTLRVDDQGLSETGPAGTVARGWAAFDRLVETKEHLFLVLGGGSAYVVRKADLPAETLAAVKHAVEVHHEAWAQRRRTTGCS